MCRADMIDRGQFQCERTPPERRVQCCSNNLARLSSFAQLFVELGQRNTFSVRRDLIPDLSPLTPRISRRTICQ